MSQFFLQQPKSAELQPFPHIVELACQKIHHIQFNSFAQRPSPGLQIFHINEGKFEWVIGGRAFTLYPGDTAVILPQQPFGSEKGFMDLGIISWVTLSPQQFSKDGQMQLGAWSGIPENESKSFGKLLLLNQVSVLSRLTAAGQIFSACIKRSKSRK